MKILLCCDQPWVSGRFGASRVTLDLLDGLKRADADVSFFPPATNSFDRNDFPRITANFLSKNAHKFDVVDYSYNTAPWIDSTKHSQTLKVARIALLWHQREQIHIPEGKHPTMTKYKQAVKRLLKKEISKSEIDAIYLNMDTNMEDADIVTVANTRDLSVLENLGYPRRKLELLPYGLTHDGFKRFEMATDNSKNRKPIVAFVGTFDFRKGSLDFPYIVENIVTSFPEFSFRFLGTRGMYQTAEKVLRQFPKRLREYIEVVETFDPLELPNLLSDCYAGVFPSYWEGFGIAVVEMLAAGLPTVAYDAPGPCDILPQEWLVPSGDKRALTFKLAKVLDDDQIDRSRLQAIQRSRDFNWDEIAKQTLEIYERSLTRIQEK
ncbi:MAG: glycosyltransferase family 4 protein [Opitutales bacterium]|nr:glycosyltransferase family 4 protein [Opitutales bacterium]